MKPKNKSYIMLGALCAFALAATPVQGKDLFRLVSDPMDLQTAPGASSSAPSGFSGSAGTAFIGLGSSVQTSRVDGGLAVGTTYGDSEEFLGGAIAISVPSLSFDGGFFEKGSLSASVGHNFSDYAAGVSVGVSGIDAWRSATSPKEDPSFYVAASQAYNFDLPTFATIGVGNNIFADKDNGSYKTDRTGIFGSIGTYVHPQMSVIVDYTGGLTTLATSIVPMPDYPVSISLGVNGFFKENPDDALMFVAGIGMSVSY